MLKPTPEAEAGSRELAWAEKVHVPDRHRTNSVPVVVGHHSPDDQGKRKPQVVSRPNQAYSKVGLLDERVAYDEATIDDEIKLAQETLKSYYGQLQFVKHYSLQQNVDEELLRTGEEITKLLAYRERIRQTNRLAADLLEPLEYETQLAQDKVELLQRVKRQKEAEKQRKIEEQRAKKRGEPIEPVKKAKTNEPPAFILRAVEVLMKATKCSREQALAQMGFK